jgi:histidinol phosphatase-like enzyme
VALSKWEEAEYLEKRRKEKYDSKAFSLNRRLRKKNNSTSILIRYISRHLRDKFKAYCALRGISMTQRIIEYIKIDVERGYLVGDDRINRRVMRRMSNDKKARQIARKVALLRD